MDGSPPGSSVHGILQARTLEWVAISFSRGSTQGLNLSLLHWQEGSFLSEPPGNPRFWKEGFLIGLIWFGFLFVFA